MRRRSVCGGLLLACAVGLAAAQTAAVSQRGLAEFEGQYDYRDGTTLFMVMDGDRLVAIVSDAKYPLRAAGQDAFTNPGGDKIPFQRDAAGHVVAFREAGDVFRRRSPDVPASVRLLLEPRPRMADGSKQTYRYQPPPQLEDGIPVSAAGAGSLPAGAAERLVQGVVDGRYPEVRSILVYHKGALRLEEYFYGFDRNRPAQMRSLTKSVISLLAGAAVDRGLLGADTPVLARLGYPTFGNPDPRKAQVTLADLLSNQSGFACNDHDRASPGNEVKMYEAPDWVRFFVDLPVLDDPGKVGRYCSGGILTAGRIVELAAGKPLPEFAQQALFDPLGIRPADWRWRFQLDRSQRNEFGQIYLRPRDMLKLGMLVRQGGHWRGRRVVSAQWIERSTAPQSKVDGVDYGLGIWHRWYRVQAASGEQRIDTIMFSGNGGQKVYIVPSLDLVAVFTGGAFNVESPVNDMMAKVLLPALLPLQH